MVSFAGGVLIILVVLVVLLVVIRRYVYPQNAAKWRNSKGLGKYMAEMYDWIENRRGMEQIDIQIEEDYYPAQ